MCRNNSTILDNLQSFIALRKTNKASDFFSSTANKSIDSTDVMTLMRECSRIIFIIKLFKFKLNFAILKSYSNLNLSNFNFCLSHVNLIIIASVIY